MANRKTRASATTQNPAEIPAAAVTQGIGPGPGRNDARDTSALMADRIAGIMTDEGDAKEGFKEALKTIVLSKADIADAHKISDAWMQKHSEVETIAEQLAAAKTGCADIMFKFALRAVKRAAETGHMELSLAWFDKLTSEAETFERQAARSKDDNQTKVESIRDILGAYWVTCKSECRRSFKAGYNPHKFNNSTSFRAASKPAPKQRSTRGSQSQVGHSGTDAPVMEDQIGRKHPSLAATLNSLVRVSLAVKDEDALRVAELLSSVRLQIEAIVRGVSVETLLGSAPLNPVGEGKATTGVM